MRSGPTTERMRTIQALEFAEIIFCKPNDMVKRQGMVLMASFVSLVPDCPGRSSK